MSSENPDDEGFASAQPTPRDQVSSLLNESVDPTIGTPCTSTPQRPQSSRAADSVQRHFEDADISRLSTFYEQEDDRKTLEEALHNVVVSQLNLMKREDEVQDRDEKLTRLRTQNKKLKERIAELEEIVAQSIHIETAAATVSLEPFNRDSEVADLTERLHRAEDEMHACELKCEQRVNHIKVNYDERMRLCEENRAHFVSELAGQVSQQTSLVTSLQLELAHVKQQLEKANDGLKHAQTKQTKIESQLRETEKQLRERDDELTEMKKKAFSEDSSSLSWKFQFDNMAKQVKAKEKDIEDITSQLTVYREDNHAQRMELIGLRDENKSMEQKLHMHNDQIEAANKKVSSLQSRLDALQREHSQCEEKSDLRGRLSRLDDELRMERAKSADATRVQMKCTQLEKELCDQKKLFGDAKTELDKKQGELEHMQLQMDRLTSEILQKDAATQEADARALRAERSNASHADDKKKTKALNEQLMAEKKRVEELERQVHEAQDRIEQLEAAHRSITNENEFLRKELREREQNSKSAQTTRIEQLTTELNEARSELDKCKDLVASLEQSTSQLKVEREDIIYHLNLCAADLEVKMGDVKTLNDELLQARNVIERADAKCTQLEGELSEALEKVDALTSVLAQHESYPGQSIEIDAKSNQRIEAGKSTAVQTEPIEVVDKSSSSHSLKVDPSTSSAENDVWPFVVQQLTQQHASADQNPSVQNEIRNRFAHFAGRIERQDKEDVLHEIEGLLGDIYDMVWNEIDTVETRYRHEVERTQQYAREMESARDVMRHELGETNNVLCTQKYNFEQESTRMQCELHDARHLNTELTRQIEALKRAKEAIMNNLTGEITDEMSHLSEVVREKSHEVERLSLRELELLEDLNIMKNKLSTERTNLELAEMKGAKLDKAVAERRVMQQCVDVSAKKFERLVQINRRLKQRNLERDKLIRNAIDMLKSIDPLASAELQRKRSRLNGDDIIDDEQLHDISNLTVINMS